MILWNRGNLCWLADSFSTSRNSGEFDDEYHMPVYGDSPNSRKSWDQFNQKESQIIKKYYAKKQLRQLVEESDCSALWGNGSRTKADPEGILV